MEQRGKRNLFPTNRSCIAYTQYRTTLKAGAQDINRKAATLKEYDMEFSHDARAAF